MVIRNVIFDWSGTLVDDLPAVLGATNAVLRDVGFPELTRDEFRSRFRLPFEDFYRELRSAIPMVDLEARFLRHFDALQSTVTTLPHAREFLEFCRGHSLRTLVLSTVPQPYYEAQSALNGLGALIDHPYPGARDKRLLIREILSSLELQPGETLFIGDMQHDIDTARHGGVWSCAVLTGYNRLDQLRASHPDLIVEHLGELRTILEQNRMRLRPVEQGGSPGLQAIPVATVGALVFDQAGQVLMVRTRKWSNRWGIPGGKIKHRETALEALRRELKEETNLDVDEVRFVLVQDCIDSPEFYREAHFILLNYTAVRTGSAPVQLNDEAEEFRWMPLDEALRLPLNKPTRVLIETVQDGASEGVMRGGKAIIPA
jgi:phosphoglycolate phosphatase